MLVSNKSMHHMDLSEVEVNIVVSLNCVTCSIDLSVYLMCLYCQLGFELKRDTAYRFRRTLLSTFICVQLSTFIFHTIVLLWLVQYQSKHY